MKKELRPILTNYIQALQESTSQSFLMGSILVVLNVMLMLLVGLYWTIPSMHQYISGRPLV